MLKGKLLNQQLQQALASENLADVKKYLKAEANVFDDNILAMRIENEEIINLLVPYISEKFKEKQTKYKISPESYQQYVFRLLKLGYSIQEANKVIFQKKYLSIIDFLLNQSHLKLIALGYQHKDIVRIASCGITFQFVIKSLFNSHKVTKLGFSQEEVIKVVTHHGSSKNLAALAQYKNSLCALGFSHEQLIKVVALKGGSKNLAALAQYENSLCALGFSHEQLIKVVAHHGGSKNLTALAQYKNSLCALGFSHEQLIKVVAHAGGTNNLHALINYVDHLDEHHNQLLTIELRETLIKILANAGGSKNLAALTRYENLLCELGFSRKELIKVVAHNGGSKNLQALMNYVNRLKQDNPLINKQPATSEMRDALVKIVAHQGGYKNLTALTRYENLLCELGFSRKELIKVVAHNGGSNNLQALMNYVNRLKQDNPLINKQLATSEMRDALVKIVAQEGGSKNLTELIKNKPTMEKLGLVEDKRIYTLLQRNLGYQRLKIFLNYYLLFYQYNAVKELLVLCSIRAYLSVERLDIILALNALVHYLKEVTNDDKFNLFSWNSSRFPGEIALLNTILKIVNKKLKGDICPLKLQRNNNNYCIISQTSCSAILTQIEKRLVQYSLNDSIQLQELLHIRNADCYRLLQNPEGNKQIYWLDVRPWKRVFPDKNLQTILIKLFKKVVKDNDVFLEENGFLSQNLSISHVGEHALSIPFSIIETIVNDYPNLHHCQLIFCQHVPPDEETKLGFLYLYKTDKTLECIVKNGKKVDNLVINRSSLTPKQNDEISEALASTGLKVQLHQSTLRALSRLILDTGKNYYLSDGSDEIIEFIDRPDNFFPPRENKLVTVTKTNKSSLLDNVIPPTLQTSPSKITALVHDNNANELNKAQYLSMPIIETSPIKATLPNKPYKFAFDVLGETENKLVADNEFIKPENKRLNEIKKFYEVKRKLTPLPSFKHEKLKKNDIIEHKNQSVPERTTFPRRSIYLGEGTYNRVYRFGPIVQKTRKNTALEMDGAKRAVRVFNEINKELNSEPGRGNVINENTWELPYIDGYVPSIEKLSNTILEIYVETERVLIDGYCKDNILKEKQSGKLYCIDPGLAVRRNSVLSKSYWYNPNTFVKANREVHYKYMVELIGKYKESKKPDKSLPIFCIFGIDFYDQNLVVNYGKIRDFCHESFLVLGIAVYFSILLKIKLNAEACIRLLRQEIEIDLENLKKSYAEEGIEKSQVILTPLFFFNPIAASQKRKATSELQWSPTTFPSKREKVNDTIIAYERILKTKVRQ